MQRDPEQTEVHYLQTFAHLHNAHILEVGCGDGRMTRRYAHHTRQVAAIDPNPERLALALDAQSSFSHLPITFIQTPAETLPFATNTFDGSIFAWSL